ncbi:MAG: hypothetical protein M3092_06935 [Actinomycetia bacterium]|nr:hypothetical protein [Actinomycetes bacterium]
MTYEHTQYGYWGAGTIVFVLIMGAITLPEAFDDSTLAGWAVTASLVALAGITVWFSWLKVRIEDTTLTAAFGPGRPRRIIDLSAVVTATPVRNKWIQGWGIRKISGGWMYNVWGLDAIEFTMASGDLVRIGTDDQDNLLASVHVFTG